MTVQIKPTLFDDRFLDKHAGAIISDLSVALVELVANAWDAYATRVEIQWPDGSRDRLFSIKDNGKGLTREQFALRWRTLNYNRVAAEGEFSLPPSDLGSSKPRRPYGRNGQGRLAGFAFSDPYEVITRAGGDEVTFEVRRSSGALPFDWREISSKSASDHGLEIRATHATRTRTNAAAVREMLGARFLTDPDFTVVVDGVTVTFDDIPNAFLQESFVGVPGHGQVRIVMIDAQHADRTTRQHGIAWHVNNRLVGECGWLGSDYSRILDGRTSEAKRFTFIVTADFLASANAVQPDWSGFNPKNEVWKLTQSLVQDRIREQIFAHGAQRRKETKEAVKEHHANTIRKAPPLARERWNEFVEAVVDSCPGISGEQVEQVAGILANLEVSRSRYGLVDKLHRMQPNELDELDAILGDWSVATAKVALDEIQNRLKLIAELHAKLRDERADEVRELQPLMERSLWVFGPEFETIEFTSNRGMSEVIRKLLGRKVRGSLNRPDFVILDDGSVGLFSRPKYGDGYEVEGIEHLVVVELKRPGIAIGMDHKNQAWKYVTELLDQGLIEESTKVTCFVMGSKLAPRERIREEGSTRIVPLAYDTFVRRAESRMLNLYERLKGAPFLADLQVDVEGFLAQPPHRGLDLD
ncbi:MAG: ATP-binding protein [Phenylobacterium sp.]|uniref:ATP-binding protein n=1 Tax=Phenylobacterium sp. TaxID=1871053 RepID=UPI0027349895|nr:ATP-binding protein [Phenylobacterium sp.]MDP1641520.1 ATP-binding protein [Phenylobacterium sp.]MDP3117659.1 ATP-binding protein [Phenylobacterium sp.]